LANALSRQLASDYVAVDAGRFYVSSSQPNGFWLRPWSPSSGRDTLSAEALAFQISNSPFPEAKTLNVVRPTIVQLVSDASAPVSGDIILAASSVGSGEH
jgi:hypothetical protein